MIASKETQNIELCEKTESLKKEQPIALVKSRIYLSFFFILIYPIITEMKHTLDGMRSLVENIRSSPIQPHENRHSGESPANSPWVSSN